MKVSQKMEGSLRGRTVAAIEYEVAGHVLLVSAGALADRGGRR